VEKKLPTTNHLRGLIPDHVLATMSQWLGDTVKPQIIRELSEGLTNSSYLLQLHNRQVVLRIHNPHSDILGIDRQQELAVLTQAIAAGLAVPLVYADPEGRFLVTEYIPGGVALSQTPAHSDSASRDALLAQMAAWLKKLHTQQLDIARHDYAALADHYWQQINSQDWPVIADIEKIRGWMQPRLQQLTDKGQFCLCHHDLVPGNLLASDVGLVAIDWEYACLGHPCFDLATVVETWDLSATETAYLLTNYDNEDVANRTTLSQMQCLYRYLELLWLAVQQQAMTVPDQESLQAVTKHFQQRFMMMQVK
jgi:thiamine kinase